ncbi:MAG: hypothetical protein AAF602_20255, partial [Myxococcota bacterium]
PDVAIVVLPDAHASRWLEILAAASQSRHIYLIGSLKAITREAVAAAWTLGIDDIFAWGAIPEEVAGRVEALPRIRSWIGTLVDDQGTKPFELAQLGTWEHLGDVVVQQIAGLAADTHLLPDDPGRRPPPSNASGLGAEVVLSLPEQHLAVRFGVVLPSTSSEDFGIALFGAPESRSMLCDALCEVANSVGGAFKRRALTSGITFALGLPRATGQHPRNAEHRWWLRHSRFELYAWASVAGSRPKRVAVGTLQEGMVLVQEVRRDNGHLLVAAGTVLTRRTVEKMRNMLGESVLVQVARA